MAYPTRHNAVSAFTLIELLVVISIVALLIAILLPALSAARRSAQQAACLSNQRQISIGTANYVAQHDDYLPVSYDATVGVRKFWHQVIEIGDTSSRDTAFVCPANDFRWNDAIGATFYIGGNYAYNLAGGSSVPSPPPGTPGGVWRRIDQFLRPSDFGIVTDAGLYNTVIPDRATTWFSHSVTGLEKIRRIHPLDAAANVLFLDSHAATIHDDQIIPELFNGK